jgi:hypothetical protein
MSCEEELQVGELTVRVEQDDQPDSPREWDCFGRMLCCHFRYRLGDKHEMSAEELREYVQNDDEVVLAIPLWLYDHSGLSMRAGSNNAFNDRWDSGQVGWIVATEKAVKEEFGAVNVKTLAKARKLLLSEVAVFDQYLTGDVWYYNITDAKGESLDSCGGMYGLDYCKEEARGSAERLWKKIQEKEENLAYRAD